MNTYYINLINWPLERITQQFQDLQKAGASLVRIMGIQRIHGKIPGEDNFSLPAQGKLKQGPLSVHFNEVSLGYSDSIASASKTATPQSAELLESHHAEENVEEKESGYCVISRYAWSQVELLACWGGQAAGKLP